MLAKCSGRPGFDSQLHIKSSRDTRAWLSVQLIHGKQQRVKSHPAFPQAPEAGSLFDPPVLSIQNTFRRGKQEVSLIAGAGVLSLSRSAPSGKGGWRWSSGSHFARKPASFLSNNMASKGTDKYLLPCCREKDVATERKADQLLSCAGPHYCFVSE